MTNNKLKNDFKIFREQCVAISRDYNTYNSLFFSGYDEILLKIAHSFFNDLAEILQRDWIMQVCKLFDPAQTIRKKETFENISIKLINLELTNDNLMSEEISNLSDSILEYGAKITPARNKRLAHFDRSHQVNGIILGATTEKELGNFLDNLQRNCDAVGLKIGLGPLDFASSSCSGDVLDLLKFLENHLRASCDDRLEP